MWGIVFADQQYSDHMCVEWWWCSVVILIASIALFQFVGGAGRSAYSVGGGKHVSERQWVSKSVSK